MCAKFGFLLGKYAVEIVTMLKEAVKDKSMSKHKCMSGLIISKEVKCLLKTNHVVDPLLPAEMTKMLKKVHQAVLADCCQNNDEISAITDVSWSSSQHILMEDLMMKWIAAKFVIWCDMQKQLKDNPHFLTKVVTGEDSWCYDYDPESKQQPSQWKSSN